MIRFKKIKWKNFLSTGDQWTEVKLNDDGTTLIVGANGAGKSTVLDAICFVLFSMGLLQFALSDMSCIIYFYCILYAVCNILLAICF